MPSKELLETIAQLESNVDKLLRNSEDLHVIDGLQNFLHSLTCFLPTACIDCAINTLELGNVDWRECAAADSVIRQWARKGAERIHLIANDVKK